MTDDELASIRASWRWVKPDHSVAKLLAYIEALRRAREKPP